MSSSAFCMTSRRHNSILMSLSLETSSETVRTRWRLKTSANNLMKARVQRVSNPSRCLKVSGNLSLTHPTSSPIVSITVPERIAQCPRASRSKSHLRSTWRNQRKINNHPLKSMSRSWTQTTNSLVSGGLRASRTIKTPQAPALSLNLSLQEPLTTRQDLGRNHEASIKVIALT